MEEIYKIAEEKGYSGIKSLEDIKTWIRREHHLHPEIYFSKFYKQWSVGNFFLNTKKGKSVPWEYFDHKYDTYEEALELSIKELLKIIK